MPILDKHTFDFFSRSPEQTRRIGARLGAGLESGDLIALQGDLGAGKTTFVRGLAQGWGAVDGVSSPTFVLVNEYRRPDGELLFHFDAYRLDSAAEAADLDIDRLLNEGVLAVEWPDRVREALPDEGLWIRMEHVDEEQRQLEFRATGERFDFVLERLQQEMFGVG